MRKLLMVGVLAAVIVGMLTTTAVVAGWFWDDPAWKVGNTEINFMWAVDDPDGVGDYRAEVGLIHPRGVAVELLTPSTERERAYEVASPKLSVTARGVEVQGAFLVNARRGADGKNVLVEIRVNGRTLASGSGTVGDKIVLSAVVPQ